MGFFVMNESTAQEEKYFIFIELILFAFFLIYSCCVEQIDTSWNVLFKRYRPKAFNSGSSNFIKN